MELVSALSSKNFLKFLIYIPSRYIFCISVISYFVMNFCYSVIPVWYEFCDSTIQPYDFLNFFVNFPFSYFDVACKLVTAGRYFCFKRLTFLELVQLFC